MFFSRMVDVHHFGSRGKDDSKAAVQNHSNIFFTIINWNQCLIYHFGPSGARYMMIYIFCWLFPIWRMVAILNLEVKVISNLVHTHCNGFVMQELVGNDILFVLLAPLLPEIWKFIFFKMADGGHIGFRGQGDIWSSSYTF